MDRRKLKVPAMIAELEGVWPMKARRSDMTILQRVPAKRPNVMLGPNALIEHFGEADSVAGRPYRTLCNYDSLMARKKSNTFL
jgi:hypothetical protein